MKSVYDIIDDVFSQMDASSFCSCYEGDMYERYPEGVDQFKVLFTLKLLDEISKDIDGMFKKRG